MNILDKGHIYICLKSHSILRFSLHIVLHGHVGNFEKIFRQVGP